MADLFAEFTASETLLAAFDKVEENQGGPGVDGESIETFALNLDGNLIQLQRELVEGSYRPRPLKRIYIDKSDGGRRPLSIPTVRDRVAQTAAAIVLTPLLDPEFEPVSFAYRKGRSVDQAIRRVIALRDNGYRWVVDADIDRYFDEIPHPLLLKRLRRYVQNQRILKLVRAWLKNDVYHAGEIFTLRKGVPQGSPLSPLLANLYLDHFDQAFAEGSARLVRFADDFVILCKTRPGAENALEMSRDVLSELRLKFNRDETRITNFDLGFQFLGVQFLKSLAFRPIEPERFSQEPEEPQPEVATTSDEELVGPMALELIEALGSERVREIRKRAKASPALEASVGVRLETERTLEPQATDPALRTLYLITQGSRLGRTSERFVISKESRTMAEVPAIKVDQIVVLGNIEITTPAMQFCLLEGIPIFLLSSRGRYYGVIDSLQDQRVSLHQAQFETRADESFRLEIARQFVVGKLSNCRSLVRRWARRKEADLDTIYERVQRAVRRARTAEDLEQLRGVEGAGAADYFRALRAVVPSEWGFEARRRRPPPDPVNALLSFGYTLLFYNTYSMVRSRGLHPYVGLFHDLRDGHAALVSDLMEEFRAPLIDSSVVTMIQRKKIKPVDFDLREDSDWPCLIGREARPKVTHAFEAAFNRLIQHPDASEGTDYRRCIGLQVDRLVAAVLSGSPSYKPLVRK